MMRLLACIYLILISHGCGKQKFPDYENKPERVEEQEAGYFTGRFTSFNTVAAGSVNAHAVVWTKGQQFYARVVMMRGLRSVIYQQYIHYGSRCPSSQDDLNHDGSLSAREVLTASGPMMIPLDRNLNSEISGVEWFPRTDGEGIYYYSRAADITKLMKDLRKMQRIEMNEDLDMDRRTIILYRSSSETFLPVACAELREDIER